MGILTLDPTHAQGTRMGKSAVICHSVLGAISTTVMLSDVMEKMVKSLQNTTAQIACAF